MSTSRSPNAVTKPNKPSDTSPPASGGELAAILSELKTIQTNITTNTQTLTSLSSRMEVIEEEFSTPSKGKDDSQSSVSSPISKPVSHRLFSSPSSKNKRDLSPDLSVDSSPPAKRHKHDRRYKKALRSLQGIKSSSEDSDVEPPFQDLLDEYEATKPKYAQDFTTSDISQKLAPILERWFWSYYSSEEVKAELEKARRPKNCPALIPPKINEEVYRSILHTPAPGKDLPSRFVHNAFMKAAQPVAVVWATLIRLETFCKTNDEPLDITLEDGATINFQELRKLLDQSLRLLGIANSQMVQVRKDILKPFLNDDFKKLCRPHIPFTEFLFGSDFKKLLDDTIKVNKMIKPVQKKSKLSFLGKGRGRGLSQERGQNFRQQRGRGYGRGYQGSNPQTNFQSQPNNRGRGSRQKGQQTKQ